MASSLRKKRGSRAAFAALPLILLYVALFPYPLGRERVARPAWAVAAAGSAQAAGTAAGALFPFRLGSLFGYVSADGAIAHVQTTQYGVALSTAGYVTYTRLATDWIERAPDGVRLRSFSGSGYPLLAPDGSRLFNVKSDLSGLIELDPEGGAIWERDFPSLLTSLSVGPELLLAGLLDGRIVVLNRQGSPLLESTVPGSRIPVVVGTALAEDGRLLAAVTGIDPQLFTVLRRAGSRWVTEMRQALPTDFRRELRMAVSPGNHVVAFEGAASAVGIADPRARRIQWLPLRGPLNGISFPDSGRAAAFSSRSGTACELVIVSPFRSLIVREPFTAREISLGSVDGQVLLAVDGRLLRIDVRDL